VWDGSSGNNGWLQELPKPLTKLVWDNAIFVSPALAAREQIATGDVVTVSAAGRQIEGGAWILPGLADGVVAVTLGYGRSVPDRLSTGAGYDAYALRGAADPWQATGATLSKTGRTADFATTQDHNTMEGHDFIRVQHEGDAPVGDTTSWSQPSIYASPRQDGGTAWGMVIDLDACIGCNACVVACQSENNIAVVGKQQVALGREMHWLRVDRYYDGPPEAPKTHFQPVPCMHCEEAPCEVGCPVEATLHDSEGLNVMVYNRCVGTRACSGYCPYKVRHFNYLDYSAGASPTVELQRNPQVTVRARGVMEKCTYCVQRIEGARIEADKRNGEIADGTVQTACQGACPTRAISFGNLHDSDSAVAKARADQRNYALLGELNTRPRTTYLAERAPRRDTSEG
jgi:molybdopterin-containing oxidoreductase family iron-sulfur binding subunit